MIKPEREVGKLHVLGIIVLQADLMGVGRDPSHVCTDPISP